MGMRRARFAIFLLVLAVAVTAARAGDDRIRFSVSGGGDASDSGGNQRETAEQAWIVHRRKELIDRENAAKDYNLYIPKESAICVKSSLSTIKRKLYEAPDVQSADSLVNHFHSSSQESGTQSWLIECFDSIATWSKRMLAGEPDRIITPNPPPTPTPAPAPAPAPAPGPVPGPISDGLAPASSPSPNSSPPVEAPGKTIFLPESFASNLSPEESPPAEKSSEDSPSRELLQHRRYKKHKDLVKELIIVVVATSLGTFALLALLFCCCFQRNSNTAGSKDGIRDEKPLLNLVDFSTSSQDNSPSLPNASHEFSASPKANGSFVSRLSMKANNHESSLGDAPTDGLPPQKSPTGKPAPPPPPPPPRSAAAAAPAPPAPPAPRPPPPPKGARGPPPAPPKAAAGGIAKRGGHTVSGDGSDPDGESGSRKAKLKPFFWDKVMASPDQAMVWHEISSGSFQFNEEMMESLFGYSEADKNRKGKKDSSSREPTVQYIHIIDRRKAQNLSILLRALNVTTEEVVDAIREGNKLPVELLQTLLKMAPTADEELKLRLYCGDMSLLGPAERFLKILVAVPFAFKRIESLIFMILFQEEVTGLKESFATLEVACKKLRNSRLFLKLLEAVLKTGNRMNVGTYRGGAQAFKLDTLLKLSDVKGTDGKSNLLHFVVQEIIRSEGIRAVRTQKSGGSLSTIKKDDLAADSSPEMLDHYRRLGLEVVSGLSTELEDVKKAAVIDADSTAATMSKLGNSLKKIRDFLESDVKNNMEEEVEYQSLLASFVEHAEADVKWLSEEEGRIMALVQSTADYFHGNAAKNEGLRVFAIVRDFLKMLDKSCKEVRESQKKTAKTSKTKETGLGSSTSLEKQQPSPVIRERLFPAIADRRVDSSSSSDDDEDSSSP